MRKNPIEIKTRQIRTQPLNKLKDKKTKEKPKEIMP